MTYAAALFAVLALIWLSWTPAPLDSAWLIAGAITAGAVFLTALSMRLFDRETAPLPRAAILLAIGVGRARKIAARVWRTGERAIAADTGLNPALVRFRTAGAHESARAAFANMAALTEGAIAVDSQEDFLLMHVLNEEDADEIDMRRLEDQTRAA
jgi:multisubunit Na+/H+ antiporter MnhE subunit